jgi:hypothetical protein
MKLHYIWLRKVGSEFNPCMPLVLTHLCNDSNTKFKWYLLI